MGAETPSPPAKTKKPLAITIAKFILHQWLLFCFGIACLLAHFFPDVAKHGGIIRAEYSILYGAVAVIFLISGLSIPKDKLVTHMLNFRLHLQVQVMSFLVIPALMCGIVRLIGATDHAEVIDRAVLAGYVLLACLPTTIASNVVMTRAAGGDDAAALVEVFIANIVGPFITPGWTVTLLPKSSVYDVWRDSNGDLGTIYSNVFKGLGLTVLLPLVLGQLIRWMWAEKTAWVLQNLYLGKAATACLVLLIWSSFSTCFATNALESFTAGTVAFIVLFNILLYIFLTGLSFLFAYPPSIFLARPKPPISTNYSSTNAKQKAKSFLHTVHTHAIKQMPVHETIAVCFCGPAKTTGLGIPLLYAMYPGVNLHLLAKLSVPVILYTTEQIFCAHFMVYLFRWWKSRTEGAGGEKCVERRGMNVDAERGQGREGGIECRDSSEERRSGGGSTLETIRESDGGNVDIERIAGREEGLREKD